MRLGSARQEKSGEVGSIPTKYDVNRGKYEIPGIMTSRTKGNPQKHIKFISTKIVLHVPGIRTTINWRKTQ